MTYPELVQQAQQLPLKSQLKLLETLATQVGSSFSNQMNIPSTNLVPLIGLNKAELHTLAESIVIPNHQTELHSLLNKNRDDELSTTESNRLDVLLDEVDYVALLKARALYTLKLYDMVLGTIG